MLLARTVLLAEQDQAGNSLVEYIYVNGQRLAMSIGTQIYYVHSNHLDAPLALTDTSGDIVWQASYSPFGKISVDINLLPESITARFPGQYADAESGFYYNYFRDYDPEIGRYIQSDPIGLAGGINTYGYVGGNPVSNFDPYGLFGMDDVWGGVYWASGGWAPSQSTVNFSAGFGDSVSFNLTKHIRHSQGICNLNYNSGSYGYGSTSGTIFGLANAGRTGFQVYKGLSKARKWRANSKTARKTRARKIAAAGSYRPSASDAALTLIGGSGVDSIVSLGSGNNKSGGCGCEN